MGQYLPGAGGRGQEELPLHTSLLGWSPDLLQASVISTRLQKLQEGILALAKDASDAQLRDCCMGRAFRWSWKDGREREEGAEGPGDT